MRDKMTVAKRILNIFTVAVVIALVSCTCISKYIFDMRTPVVSVVKPASMEINGEMYYNKVIPKARFSSEAKAGNTYMRFASVMGCSEMNSTL